MGWGVSIMISYHQQCSEPTTVQLVELLDLFNSCNPHLFQTHQLLNQTCFFEFKFAFPPITKTTRVAEVRLAHAHPQLIQGATKRSRALTILHDITVSCTHEVQMKLTCFFVKLRFNSISQLECRREAVLWDAAGFVSCVSWAPNVIV